MENDDDDDDDDGRDASGREGKRHASMLRELGRGEDGVTIVGFWETRGTPDPLAALHFLSRRSAGAPAFRCSPKSGLNEDLKKAIEDLHEEMVRENKSAVMPTTSGGRTGELHLVAVPDAEEVAAGDGDRGARNPKTMFVAFQTDEMAPAYAQGLLKHNRLVVVLDLDETLVQATTLHALDRRIETARSKMLSLMKFDFNNPRLTTVMIDEVKKEKQACETALRRSQLDRQMLMQFVTEGAVTVNNRRSVTIPEIEPLSNGMQRLRNVIRIPSPHTKGAMLAFTLIDPSSPATAMLVHIRPGWGELRSYLSGSDRGSKRAETFVCTMANIDYAREMCRLLDPHGTVFDPAQLNKRIKSVKPDELKSLSDTCGLHFPSELAVIVDDRTAVWEPSAQSHILAVTPFMPYGTDVEFGTGIEQNEASGSGGVLGKVQSMLETVRLRWHMDYGRFAAKARMHVHDTASFGAIRARKVGEGEDQPTSTGTSVDTLRAEHNRKKSERLFYPQNTGDLIQPLMEIEAKDAALNIAERGGATRAAAGSGSRLAAALGVLSRPKNNAKSQQKVCEQEVE